MKQIILPLIISLFIFQAGIAQVSLTLTPNPIAPEGFADPNDLFVELIGYATLKNEGSETIDIRWERVISDMPEEWEVQVCDYNQCYVQIVYSNIADDLMLDAPVTLAPGETTNLDVHVKPKGVAGAAEINVEVAVANDPGNVILTGTYTFDATMVSGSRDIDKARLAVYPNPVTDYLEVQGASDVNQLVLHNILGRRMRSFNVAPGSRYYVGDLPSGMYLASLLNRNGSIMKTFRLSKRSIRP